MLCSEETEWQGERRGRDEYPIRAVWNSLPAGDGKAIRTHARPRPKGAERPGPDGRRDTDADRGAETRRETKGRGTFGVHGRVSATVQDGRPVLLCADRLRL